MRDDSKLEDFTEKCGSCKFWNLTGGVNVNAQGKRERISFHHDNECRRHAPTHARYVNGQGERQWPVTQARDWCGDHVAYDAPAHALPAGSILLRFFPKRV